MRDFLEKNIIWLSIALFAIIVFVIVMAKKKNSSLLSESNPGTTDLSYLGRTDLPRGIRNNNPGNLTKTSIPWQGKIWFGKDARFEQFESFVWGLRAMLKDLTNDIVKDKDNTIRKLITKYAPPNENNTNGYISTLSNKLGIDPDATIAADKETLRAMSKEICTIENGNPNTKIGKPYWFDDLTFDIAHSLL